MPETNRLVVVTFEPVALLKLKLEMVPETDNTLVKLPETMFMVVPFKVAMVPDVNDMVEPVAEPMVNVAISPVVARNMVANKLVLVVLVPVALVQMRLAMESEPVKVKFAMVALVAAKLVVVALVVVTFAMTALPAVILVNDPFKAFMLEPEAVAKPNQLVDVPLTVKRLV